MYFLGAASGGSGAIAMVALPPGVKSVYLQGSASGIQWRMTVASGAFVSSPTNNAGPFAGGFTQFASGYSGINFVASGGVAFLDGPGLVSGPFRVMHNPNQSTTVIAVLNPGLAGGAVSVQVFASPTQ